MTQKRFSSVDDIPDFMTAAKDFRSDIEQTNSPLSLFDNEAPDLKMARKLVDESINIVGAEINIYLRTNNNDISEVWEEDADPTYWNPFKIKAFFKPSPIELELKKSGVDVENKMEISLSHRQIYMVCRERMLRAGDVIRIPYNSAQVDIAPRFFRVTNAAPSGNFRYNWLYLSCKLESITADITVRPIKDIVGDIEIIKTNGAYRESL